jgi:DNA-binding NarL/FixJ family response regulator
LQIVCEVSDGLEAVHKAEELQPDLILLDVGLPSLNGIEAARRIRKVARKSKILFLSQESSADVVQEALGTGAAGHVVKAHAGSELLTAVEALRQCVICEVADYRVTFPPSLPMCKLPTVSIAMRLSHRQRRQTTNSIV